MEREIIEISTANLIGRVKSMCWSSDTSLFEMWVITAMCADFRGTLQMWTQVRSLLPMKPNKTVITKQCS